MVLTKNKKSQIIQKLKACLAQEPEIDKIVVFGSFLSDVDVNDIDVAIFQHSDESYLPLAMKYRKLTREIAKHIPLDIVPVSKNCNDSAFLKEIETGELVYER